MTPILHFEPAEFAARSARLEAEIAARGLDALFLFAPESQYWLTGFDSFGFCFFQCLVIAPGRVPALLTRSADLRQAELTSTIGDVRIWRDGATARPAEDLAELAAGLGLSGARIGVEWESHGLTAGNGRRLEAAFEGRATLVDASDLVPALRLTKSPAEIAYVRRAAALADDALDAALAETRAGADEGEILAAMQGAVFAGGGDYPGNPFIIGSGPKALLCRYATGRRRLGAADQLTLEWAGSYRHYHAAMMRTLLTGDASPRHRTLHAAAEEALLACEATLRPGRTLGDVFAAHAETLDAHGLADHRLNACGYALGARYAPSWMEPQMFVEGSETPIGPNQVYFLHMILMDSDTGTAMSLGRTSLTGGDAAEPLSRHSLALDPGA